MRCTDDRTTGQTSSSAFQKPSAPSPTAISGAIARPRRFTSTSSSPALRALADADLEADEFLLALGRGADQHEHALGMVLHPRLKVDAVRPDIHVAARRQVPRLPALVLGLPLRGEAADHGWREVGRVPFVKLSNRIAGQAGSACQGRS